MERVIAAYNAGSLLDIDQLHDELKLSASKQALQCSIRFLEKKSMLERSYQVRRRKLRLMLQPSPAGLLEFFIL